MAGVETPANTGEPRISVIVPTRNAGAVLEDCLRSIREQDVDLELIVVDRDSTDDTVVIARRWADRVLTAGPERSRQRNVGAEASRAPLLAFIDADMRLMPGVLREALTAIDAGAGAVVIPEVSVGRSFVARVRAFERAFYAEGTAIEAARVFRRDLFSRAGGFDETLLGPEDWDLHLRVARLGARVSRTAAVILHEEGSLTLVAAWRKKAYYASGVRRFLRRYGSEGIALATDRPWLRQPWRLVVPHPLLGLGLLVLKGGEVAAMALALARARLRPRELGRHAGG